MRSYPQPTKKYRKTDEICREWDLGLTLPDDYLVEVSRIVDAVDQLDTTYALVGGVEYVLPKTDLIGHFRQATKSGTTVGKYHVHIALIFRNPVTREQILSWLGREASVHRNYCRARQQRYPYCTWKYHHIKPDTKIGEPILFESGLLPDDDINDPEMCEMIIRIGTRYGAGKEVALVKEHLLLLELEEKRKHVARDPGASLAKAQVRLDNYTKNLEAATTDEEKTKWSNYIALVKRDHFPDH